MSFTDVSPENRVIIDNGWVERLRMEQGHHLRQHNTSRFEPTFNFGLRPSTALADLVYIYFCFCFVFIFCAYVVVFYYFFCQCSKLQKSLFQLRLPLTFTVPGAILRMCRKPWHLFNYLVRQFLQAQENCLPLVF